MIEEISIKTSTFTEPQILAILRREEGGLPVPELRREHGISNSHITNGEPIRVYRIYHELERNLRI